MDVDDFRKELQEAIGSKESVDLHPEVLKDMSIADLPEGVRAGIGVRLGAATHIHWEGEFYIDEGTLKAEVNYVWTRKYWDMPLGLEYYLDLVRRALERRSELRGDVQLDTYEDDGVFMQLVYTIDVPETNLEKAYVYALKLQEELHEVAEETAQSVVDMSLAAVRSPNYHLTHPPRPSPRIRLLAAADKTVGRGNGLLRVAFSR